MSNRDSTRDVTIVCDEGVPQYGVWLKGLARAVTQLIIGGHCAASGLVAVNLKTTSAKKRADWFKWARSVPSIKGLNELCEAVGITIEQYRDFHAKVRAEFNKSKGQKTREGKYSIATRLWPFDFAPVKPRKTTSNAPEPVKAVKTAANGQKWEVRAPRTLPAQPAPTANEQDSLACPHCGKVCGNKGGLMSHVRSKHPTANNQAPEKPAVKHTTPAIDSGIEQSANILSALLKAGVNPERAALIVANLQ